MNSHCPKMEQNFLKDFCPLSSYQFLVANNKRKTFLIGFSDLPPTPKWMTFQMGLLILVFCDNRTSIKKTHGPGQYGMYFGLFVSLLQTQSLLWTRHLQYFFHFWIWCSPNQHGLPLDFLLWLLWQKIADMIKCCRCEYHPLQIQ